MRTKPVFFMLIIALSLFSACSQANEQSKGEKEIAADFTLESLEGEKIFLSELLQSKMVVLDFWASWCSPCRRVIPDLEKFYTKNQDRVTVIGVNIQESNTFLILVDYFRWNFLHCYLTKNTFSVRHTIY